jgi:hypothetical protein
MSHLTLSKLLAYTTTRTQRSSSCCCIPIQVSLFKMSLSNPVTCFSRSFNSSEHFHALSLLFIIFAIATLFDSNSQPFSAEAQVYYHLSRTSLSFAPPYHATTLASIQTLVSSIFCNCYEVSLTVYLKIHMALYLDLSDSGGSDSAWLYIGHAVRLGYSVGGLFVHLTGANVEYFASI